MTALSFFRPSPTAVTIVPAQLRLVTQAFRLRDERAGDVAARETLLDACFGRERFAKTCERLREGRAAAPGLSFVAHAACALVGTLRLWDVTAGGRRALLLGPLAVDAGQRSTGIGAALTAHGLRRARALGHTAVLLVGDEPYYRRFGFARRFAEGLELPGPVDAARFLGLELVAGALECAQGLVCATGTIADAKQAA